MQIRLERTLIMLVLSPNFTFLGWPGESLIKLFFFTTDTQSKEARTFIPAYLYAKFNIWG